MLCLISVIIPTYRPGAYIYECLDSIAKQTLSAEKFELIIILNGYKEPYEKELHSYFAAYLSNISIKYIYTNEIGVSNARNIGIEAASGEYFVFVDDDDYISNVYLERLLEKVAPGTMVLSNSVAVIDGGSKNVRYKMSEIYDRYQSLPLPSLFECRSLLNGPCMKLIGKASIGPVRFNRNFRNGEDSLFIFEISSGIKQLAFTSADAIYYRRIRPGSAMTSQSFHNKVLNAFRVSMMFTRIWLRAPFKYNFCFYWSRVLAPFRGLLH